MDVTVKYGRETLSLHLEADATIAQLQQQLEERTGLMVRKQKVMASGKVISGRSGTLAAAGIKAGAKLMLLAGAAAPSQGQAALEAARQSRQEALERGRQQLAARAAEKGISTAAGASSAATSAASMAQRAEAWSKTGIAALRDLKLACLPPELFGGKVAPALRVLDCGGNALSSLPPAITQLTSLQRLRLSLNQLTDAGMQWGLLAGMPQLLILAADDNHLTSLPECISGLARLQKLSLAGNQIASLPNSLSQLQQLRSLGLRGNRLAALPAALRACRALEELDVRDNQLVQLPPELGQISNLKRLLLDNNRLQSVPPEILTGCSSLASLSLHGNPLTVEELREAPGWREFDERRRSKYDKQLGMQVMSSGFDEGADAEEFEHWNT